MRSINGQKVTVKDFVDYVYKQNLKDKPGLVNKFLQSLGIETTQIGHAYPSTGYTVPDAEGNPVAADFDKLLYEVEGLDDSNTPPKDRAVVPNMALIMQPSGTATLGALPGGLTPVPLSPAPTPAATPSTTPGGLTPAPLSPASAPAAATGTTAPAAATGTTAPAAATGTAAPAAATETAAPVVSGTTVPTVQELFGVERITIGNYDAAYSKMRIEKDPTKQSQMNAELLRFSKACPFNFYPKREDPIPENLRGEGYNVDDFKTDDKLDNNKVAIYLYERAMADGSKVTAEQLDGIAAWALKKNLLTAEQREMLKNKADE